MKCRQFILCAKRTHDRIPVVLEKDRKIVFNTVASLQRWLKFIQLNPYGRMHDLKNECIA